MSNLLITKLQIPRPRPEVMSRPQLVHVLNAGLEKKLTLVSAPAGFGKTTLVSSWARVLDDPVAWLSLDTGDNDCTRFIRYLVTALRTANPDCDVSRLPIPPTTQPELMESVSTAILNQLAALAARQVLILDDYHVISNDAIHSLLRHLVEHLPGQAHICLLTRADPPLPLSRWRGLGALQELRAADLKFTEDEARQFLAEAIHIPLTARQLDIIETKSEGWITGLKLAALSLDRHADASRFIQSFSGSHEYIADYLTDEVLASQPEQVRSFLLQTSILEHLTVDLCDATRDQRDSRELLKAVERGNLFLASLDETRLWYRYHQLFADLLRKRLYLRAPETAAALHARASEWFEQQVMINEAIRHALAAGNTDRAASLIEQNILDTILEGEFYQAQTWLDDLPEPAASRPVLYLAKAWISVRNLSGKEVHEHIRHSEAAMQGDQASYDYDVTALIERHLATLKAIVARMEGEPPEVQQELIVQALDVVPQDSQALQGMLRLRLGLTYMDLGLDQEADRAFKEVIARENLNSSTYNLYGAVYARTLLAHLQGRLHDVEDLCKETLQRTGRASAPWQEAAVRSFVHIALGLVQLEWNDLAAAEANLKRGLTLNAPAGLTEVQVKGEYALGRLMIAQGKRPAPIELGRFRDGALPVLGVFAEALQAHLWLMAANRFSRHEAVFKRAVHWANRQALRPVEGYDRDWQIKRQLIYIRVLIANLANGSTNSGVAEFTQAAELLEDLQKTYRAHGWVDRVIEILIVKAMVEAALHEVGEAPETLASALSLAEPRGYTRIFLDEGEGIVPLLYNCVERGYDAREYAARLLVQYRQEKTIGFQETASSSPQLIEALTPREIEVLTLIAEGLTNREIGQRLSISLGTVKRHTANINGKLSAHTRTEAVAIARSLKILT